MNRVGILRLLCSQCSRQQTSLFSHYSPLEEYPEAAVGREESPLDEVELVEVLEEQRDAVRVPRRRPHRLPDVHELCKVASKIQGVPSGRGLGLTDMYLGCSTILPGQ